MQVPALPAIAHDMQLPVQVVAQQTPCAQWVDLQSPSAPQLAPGGLRPQLPFTQKLPVVQSASAEQVVLHWPEAEEADVAQVNGAHDWLIGAPQFPAPSQRPANVSVDPVQPAMAQATPATYFSQAPAPSQKPSFPQVEAPSSVQSFRGSVPTSAGMQVPTLPDELQVSQVPVQAVLQQTPSAQKVEAQSAPVLHACPICAVPPIVWSTDEPMSWPVFPPPLPAMSFFIMPPSVVGLPPPLLQAADARTRIDATRSARTLGWGEPMVIGRPF